MLDDGDDDDDEVNFEDDDDDEFNLAEIVCDPAHRQLIADYHPNIQDQVRRAHILKGPTRPTVKFDRKKIGSKNRAFSKNWYKNYEWLEYSVSEQAAFCFYCFLFKQPGSSTHFGYDVFTKNGFRDWKHAYQALPAHVGGVNSAHKKARLHYDDFHNQRQSVSSNFARSSKESEVLYKIRLHTSLGCARYLIAQGLAFRGHDESSTSLNKGNFHEMVDWLKARDEKVRNAFGHGSRNCKMLAAEIQEDLAKCCAEEVTKAIMREIGDKKFSVLIDESCDISVKEKCGDVE
ncbi:zinc finger MYM-type protein 1-like, partial [Triticum dicoccoides]|uniref:zinc finger MYM-type protein 1-like n=1 Tax=Triticum dicoccoides TaxID=85692 RepID=UPI00188FEA52